MRKDWWKASGKFVLMLYQTVTHNQTQLIKKSRLVSRGLPLLVKHHQMQQPMLNQSKPMRKCPAQYFVFSSIIRIQMSHIQITPAPAKLDMLEKLWPSQQQKTRRSAVFTSPASEWYLNSHIYSLWLFLQFSLRNESCCRLKLVPCVTRVTSTVRMTDWRQMNPLTSWSPAPALKGLPRDAWWGGWKSNLWIVSRHKQVQGNKLPMKYSQWMRIDRV